MYTNFAGIYDDLMFDSAPIKRAEFINSLFEKYGKKPSLLLDLACGTGKLSAYFAKNGVSVIGVDVSSEMLSVAREETAGLDILYLNQDMCELDLYGTVNRAVCTMDSLNHLDSYEEFCTALQKTALFLEKDCLFIFDLNTPYKHKNILSDNCFIKESDGVLGAWSNEYEKEDNRVNINLDFFIEQNGKYIRKTEQFSEIAFNASKVKRAIKKAKLEILAEFDGDTFSAVNNHTQRILYVTKKAE